MSFILKRWASTAPKVAKFQAERPEEIVKLLKPIGLISKPSLNMVHESKTFKEKREELMDPKKNRVRREELKKELAKSSFEHVYGFRHTGGKIFTAPPFPFDEQSALYMINIKGKLLGSNEIGETTLYHQLSSTSPTLVRLFSSALGQQQIKEFTQGSDLRSLGVKVVDVNIPVNWINRLLVKWFGKKIYRQEVGDSADIHKYLVASEKISPSLRKSIMATNELAGYLYVVDKNGKIRWATSGPVIENEMTEMLNIIKSLS